MKTGKSHTFLLIVLLALICLFHGLKNNAVAEEGAIKWRFQTKGDINSSPAQGGLKWYFQAGDAIDSSPLIGSDKNLYVGLDTDELLAITCRSQELAHSIWPMFRRDIKHTGCIAGKYYTNNYSSVLRK